MSNKVEKATKKVHKPRPRTDINGTPIIENNDDARIAVERVGTLINRMDRIKQETGLGEFEKEYELLRQKLRDYQEENELDSIEGEAWKSDLVERTAATWVWDKEDLEALKEKLIDNTGNKAVNIRALQATLEKKFPDVRKRLKIINKITKRVIVPSAVDELVKDGTLTLKDVEKSFIKYIATTYVQVKQIK